jgi:hypothetical protein
MARPSPLALLALLPLNPKPCPSLPSFPSLPALLALLGPGYGTFLPIFLNIKHQRDFSQTKRSP